MIYLLARAAGATPIILVDVALSRLEFAVQQLGANIENAVHVDANQSMAEASTKVLQAFKGIKPDVAFECTGYSMPIHTCLGVLEAGGCLVQVGIGAPVNELSFSELLHRQVDLRFVMRSNSCFEDCIRLVENGVVDPSLLITHVFPIQVRIHNPIDVNIRC